MFDFIFLTFLLYGYKVGLIDYSILLPFFMVTTYIILKPQKRLLLSYSAFYLISIFFFIFCISGISALYNNSLVSEYYFRPLRAIVVIFLAYFYFYYRDIGSNKFLKILLYVLLLNSLVILLQYALYYLNISDNFLFHPDIGRVEAYRKPGLTSGFPTGGMCAIFGSFLSIYLYFESKISLYLYLFIIFSLSIFLTARSVMYIFILLMPIYLFLQGVLFNKLRILIYCAAASLLIIILIQNNMNYMLEGSINKMFANVINYVETGDFNDYSTRQLLSYDHFKIPVSFRDILIGNSLPHTSKFMVSDIGYFRIWWANGIFSLLLYLLAFFFVWRNAYFRYSKTSSKKIKSFNILVFFTFFTVFIMCFKGSYLFSRVIGDFLILLFLWRKKFNESKTDFLN